MHGVVAEARIPSTLSVVKNVSTVTEGIRVCIEYKSSNVVDPVRLELWTQSLGVVRENYASLGGFYSMEVRVMLPISEYQACDLAFQVPAGENLLVSVDWQVTECTEDVDMRGQGGGGGSTVETRGRKPKVSWREEKDKRIQWQLTPEFPDELAEKFAGFIHESLDEDDEDDPGAFSFRLSINCNYPGKLADLDVDALRETVPSAVTGLGVAVAPNSFDISSPLQYLRLLSTLAVVARHDRPLQKAREKFMRRFPETFLVG